MSNKYNTRVAISSADEIDARKAKAAGLGEQWLKGSHNEVIAACISDMPLIASVALYLSDYGPTGKDEYVFLHFVSNCTIRS